MRTPICLATAAWALAACRSAPAPAAGGAAREVTLLYTGDIHGVTEPCGCTADVLLGGIDRLGTVIARARKDAGGVVLVDGGNVLGSQVPPPPGREAQERVRADVLADALRLIGYDAVAVGPLDLVFGLDALRAAADRGVPWVAANLRAAEPPWAAWRMVRAGGAAVAVVGLMDPALLPPTDGVTADPPGPALAAAVAEARAGGADLVVAAGSVDLRAARRLLKDPGGVDVFVRTHATRRDDTPRPAGAGHVVEPHEEGQSVGRMRISLPRRAGEALRPGGLSDAEHARLLRRKAHLEASGRTAAAEELAPALAGPRMSAMPAPPPGAFLNALLVVTPEVPADPDLEALRRGFNRRLKEINLAHAAPPPPLGPGDPGYAGAAACGMCHDQAERFWRTTPHARAVETLALRDKDFDDECISCHVTGYRAPGGSTLGHLGLLADVQCEACHGPLLAHNEDGTAASAPPRDVPEAVCVQCHNAKHSPGFAYAAWRSRIVGPGHGDAPPRADR